MSSPSLNAPPSMRIKTAAGFRLFLRKSRRAAYSLTGRNPLVGPAHVPSSSEEWKAIEALMLAQQVPPVLKRKVAIGSVWSTCVGDFAFLDNLDPFYIRLAAEEQALNIYAYSSADKLVVDCGANVGLFTKHALEAGADHVIAFEPSPGNAECFCFNLEQELKAGKITLIRKGLFDKTGEVRFFTPEKDPFAHQVSDEGDTSIPVTTLDAALKELGVERVDFVKMDIEGSELQAISGATDVLTRMRPRIAIATEHTEDYYANSERVIRKMETFGYGYTCTQSLPTRSLKYQKDLITPHCTLFTPPKK